MRNRATTPLSKAKVRQSWSKYNLYNLSRVRSPPYRSKTFYQQKWLAKSLLRDYHGEPVREAHWNKMFRHRLKAVVPMDPNYMARNDGSAESAGRGSGLKDENESRKKVGMSERIEKEVPYMNMAFAPLERRLDTAIFRAMFASSTRQARQFVVHGAVKVNGHKMQYPGYLLNPGDMFQVDPERVMFATGAPKEPTKAASKSGDVEAEETPENAEPKEAEPEPEVEEQEDIEDDRTPRQVLKDLQSQAKSILSHERAKIGAKKKQDLRGFTKAVRRMLSRSTNSTILTESLEAQFAELKNQLRIQRQEQKDGKIKPPSEQAKRPDFSSSSSPDKSLAEAQLDAEDAPDPVTPDEAAAGQEDSDPEATYLSDADLKELQAAFESSSENPIDPLKPYATPWRPRDYMSAFAFIPRYLEVNQNICAAVYLRHPVVKPGLAEVPTPFGTEVGGAAYVWYLRRR